MTDEPILKFHMRPQPPRKVITYRCLSSTCGAIDRLDLEIGEPASAIINCHKCHAGIGLKSTDQMKQRQGMIAIRQQLGDGPETPIKVMVDANGMVMMGEEKEMPQMNSRLSGGERTH